MPLVRIGPKPGVNSQLSQTQNADGWFASNLVRWKLGLVEKLGGWVRLIEPVCAGYIRKLHGWQDLTNNKNLLVGTDAGPQLIVNTSLYDLTIAGSFAQGGSGSNFANFTVSNGSSTVRVGITTALAATLSVGETFTFKMPVSIGNRIISSGNAYTVAATSSSSFQFAMASAATTSQSNIVGIPLFSFNQEDPTVVSFRRHGLIAGGTFHVDLATALKSTDDNRIVNIPGGTDLDVETVPDVNTFTIDASSYMSGGTHAGVTGDIYEGTNSTGGTATYGTVFTFGATATAALNPNLQQWSLDNLGEIGLLVYSHSPLYIYQPPVDSGAELTPVGSGLPATAPQQNHGMLVAMPQAQVLLWGTEPVMGESSIDPLLIRFSDAGSYDTWTATASNQAGSYRLSKGSMIIGAIQTPQTTLVFTDVDVWSMSYQGPPLVYGFTIVGSACGLAAAAAVGVIGRTTYWLGSNGFWTFSETGVKPLPCPVWDIIFRDLDTTNIDLAFAAANSGFNEIAFFYPSLANAGTPPTNKIIYSQLFSDASWLKDGATIVNSISSPDGGADASNIVEDTTTGFHSLSEVLSKARESLTLTFAIYAHKDSTRWLQLIVSNAANGANQGSSVTLNINPITGTIAASGTTGVGWAVVTTGTSTDEFATGIAGNGWLRYYITCTTDSTGELIATIQNMTPAQVVSYAGNGTGFARVWGAMLNEGALVAYEETFFLLTNNPSRYVKYNVTENLWDYGELVRTSWLNDSIFGTPLGGDSDFRIQQHEQGYDDDDEPMRDVFIETGYGTVSDGSTIMLVDQCQPDLKWFGNDGAVTVTLKSLRYPGGPQQQYGPYSVTPTTQFFSTRVRAKQVAMRYDWAPLMGYSARVGATSFRVKPAGTRP